MNDIQSTLDAIDAAVEQKCACGCGIQLDPDGPSQWYAKPECQQRFLGESATDPGDVYRRPDAAMVYPELDAMPVPLGVEARDRYDVTTFRDYGRRSEPLRRLSSGPLRDPLSVRGQSPVGVWFDEIHEWDAHTTGRAEDWIAANPAVGVRIEPQAVADWPESQGLQLDPWQRQMLEAVYTPRVPAPPSPEEVMDNMRRYMRLIEDQPTFVGNQETVHRVRALGCDLDIITSPLVPEGTIIAIDNTALNRAREEALRHVSIGLQPVMQRLNEGLYDFRCSMRVVADSFRPLVAGLTNAIRSAAETIDALEQTKRARMRFLHVSYRQRCLARRRRNR